MADTVSSRAPKGQLSDAIALFEGILLSMPDDRVSLEALALAYEQMGDVARSRQHMVRLAKVLIKEGDAEAAGLACEQLRGCAGDDPAAAEMIRQLEAFAAAAAAAPVPAAKQEVPRAPVSDVALRRQILQREMSLAWDLLEAGDLNQDDYAVVVKDLSDLTADDRVKTISVLHDVADRNMQAFGRVLGGLSRRSGKPIIPLASFDPQPDAYTCLPLDYMVRQGVLPFEVMSRDLLVAVLNPTDPELKRDVASMSGRACHFYLTTPADFDAAMQIVASRLAK